MQDCKLNAISVSTKLGESQVSSVPDEVVVPQKPTAMNSDPILPKVSTSSSSTTSGCYFEENLFGFRQKRVLGESSSIPAADKQQELEMKSVLCPDEAGQKGGSQYGHPTKYLAIDCEFDHIGASITQLRIGADNKVTRGIFQVGVSGQNIPIKVTVVNEHGLIVLDTLIKPTVDGLDENEKDVEAMMNYKSQQSIHGIKTAWLNDAPTLQSVREHINELCGKKLIKKVSFLEDQLELGENSQSSVQQDDSPQKVEKDEKENQKFEKSEQKEKEFVGIDPTNFNENIHSTFIGHGVKTDLRILKIYDVPFSCTAEIEATQNGQHQAKKLKDLVQKHLNAEIQDGHHSSIIDARCTLALFLKLREPLSLALYGPDFLDRSQLISYGRKRRSKIISAASTRSVTKSLQMQQPLQELDMNRDLPSKKDAIADKENIEQPRTMNMQEFEAEMRKLVLGDGEKDQDNGKSNSSMIQDERLYRVDKLMLKKLIDEQVTQILKEIV